ncbi:beta-lactamase family protein [Neobacillus mesonae]|nr:beta-lactamase family protein [Neobacillus mesonae]
MKRIIFCLMIFMLVHPSLSQAAENRDTSQQIEAFMIKALDEYRIPGASLAVVHDGQTVFENSWGSMSDGSAVTPDTTFLIGSVSKPLTSLAIMILVEENEIKLDEAIEHYIPWFTYKTDSGKSITVRHLLEQTSGISAYDGMKVADQKDRDVQKGITEAVAELSGVELRNTPGEKYEYNSANYLLLGAMIEEVSHQSFSQFMNERIFKPLEMNDTTADYASAHDKGFVPGFQSWLGKAVEGEGLYDHSGAPYGYMSSTSKDLTIFINFMLTGGELLTDQNLKLLQTAPTDGRRYGLGWHFPRSGDQYPYHTGATTEYKSEIFYIPEQELGAVLLTNKYHELEAVSYLSIMEGIRAIMSGEEPNLAPLSIKTQWIILIVVILLAALSSVSLIRLRKRTSINKSVFLPIGVISVLLAVGLIPIFTSSMDISWRTVGLFLPDVEFLIYCVVAILLVYGLVTLVFTAKRRKVNE